MRNMVRSSWVAVSGMIVATLLVGGAKPAYAQDSSETVTPAVKAPELSTPTNQPPAAPGEKVQRIKPILVTGSNIPSLEDQPVAPILKIDKEMIDRSGASNVKQVLIRQGIH